MLPRRFRLQRSRLFPKTLAAGKTLGKNHTMVVLALPRAYDSDSPTKFGFVVSKKIHNRANRRNKVKRRLRELVRTHVMTHQAQAIAPYIAVVIIARQGILEASYAQLKQSLSHWLKSHD